MMILTLVVPVVASPSGRASLGKALVELLGSLTYCCWVGKDRDAARVHFGPTLRQMEADIIHLPRHADAG